MGSFSQSGTPGCIKNMFPVIPFAADIGDHKGKQGQDHGNRNISGKIGPARRDGDKPQHIVDPDKEESGQQIGHITFIFRTQWKV